MDRGRVGCGLVVVAVALAGCGGLLGGTETPTLTPAPVPEAAATPAPGTEVASPTPAGTPGPIRPEGWTALQPEYRSLRPTCERPPGLVLHIQIAALQNNDPETNEGINTTWQFAAPSTKASVGSLRIFTRLITESYRPLLTAERVTYGEMSIEDGVARRNVTVETDGVGTTYVWQVERQTDNRYEGCWMTTSVRRAS